MYKIYHNPRCRKSRAGLDYLKSKTQDFEIIEYLKNPLSVGELESIFQKMDIPVEDLIRKQEELYKKNYKGNNLTEKEWIMILAENPQLLQRPIVETENKAVLANPPENLNIIF